MSDSSRETLLKELHAEAVRRIDEPQRMTADPLFRFLKSHTERTKGNT